MVKVGDKIKITYMHNEPSYYGKTGTIIRIDELGQLHGSWGGLAIIPDEDEFEVIEKEICCICKQPIEGFGNNPAPFKGNRCCDKCNQNYVIPLRIYSISKVPTSAVLFKTDGTVSTVKPKNKYFTLKELQDLVDGLIQIYPQRFNNLLVVCNEEGILLNLPKNEIFKKYSDISLLGDILLCPPNIFEEPEDEESDG